MRGSQEQQPFTGRCWGFGGCRCFCRSSRALVKIRSFQSGKRTTTAELRICDSSELGTLLVLGHLALFFLFQEIKNIQFFQGTQCRPNNHKPSCAGEIPCCWWRVRVCFFIPARCLMLIPDDLRIRQCLLCHHSWWSYHTANLWWLHPWIWASGRSNHSWYFHIFHFWWIFFC